MSCPGTFGIFQNLQIIGNHWLKVGVLGAFWPHQVNILAIFGIQVMHLVIFHELLNKKNPQHILFQNRRSVLASHLLGDHTDLHIDFENFEIIADHRRSSQIIADHWNPTFGKEVWDHRRSSQIIADHRQRCLVLSYTCVSIDGWGYIYPFIQNGCP